MSYSDNPYAATTAGNFAIHADADARATFITKTYAHLVGAVAVFIALEAVLINVLPMESIMARLFATRFGWLAVLGGFMVVSWIAESWAQSSVSLGRQYAGLGLYILAEALIFTPLIWIAYTYQPNVLMPAALTTLGLFGALTVAVFITRTDFSFLRSLLFFGGIAALGFIVVATLTGFTLGPIFIYAMIALSCGYILYYTSNVLHHYRTTQYVAAALALFAAVALLFWYILQLFMSRD